jgi:hypothetical protein
MTKQRKLCLMLALLIAALSAAACGNAKQNTKGMYQVKETAKEKIRETSHKAEAALEQGTIDAVNHVAAYAEYNECLKERSESYCDAELGQTLFELCMDKTDDWSYCDEEYH